MLRVAELAIGAPRAVPRELVEVDLHEPPRKSRFRRSGGGCASVVPKC